MARKDRRKESRIPYRSTVELKFPKKKMKELITRDISITGAYVEGLSGHKKGDQCEIALFLVGESSELLLKLKGEIVRIEDDGAALEFFDVKRDSFYHLKNIAYVASMNPDDIICTNYKKPRQTKIVINEEDLEKAYDDYDA